MSHHREKEQEHYSEDIPSSLVLRLEKNIIQNGKPYSSVWSLFIVFYRGSFEDECSWVCSYSNPEWNAFISRQENAVFIVGTTKQNQIQEDKPKFALLLTDPNSTKLTFETLKRYACVKALNNWIEALIYIHWLGIPTGSVCAPSVKRNTYGMMVVVEECIRIAVQGNPWWLFKSGIINWENETGVHDFILQQCWWDMNVTVSYFISFPIPEREH